MSRRKKAVLPPGPVKLKRAEDEASASLTSESVKSRKRQSRRNPSTKRGVARVVNTPHKNKIKGSGARLLTGNGYKEENEKAAFAALKKSDPKAYYEYFIGNRIDQELFRSAIARDDHYDKIMGCVSDLMKLEKELKEKKEKDTMRAATVMNSIKTRMAAHFKLLDKLLPNAALQASTGGTPEELAIKLGKALREMQGFEFFEGEVATDD